MARKKIEKAHWVPNESLRPLSGTEDEDDEHLRRERVVLTLDDAGLRKMQHEILELRKALEPLRTKADEIKLQMKEKQQREKALMEAMIAGTLTEWREVYAYANDAEQTVHLYDPADKTLLATRDLHHHERQMEFDYGPTKIRDFDPAMPTCPETRWHELVRDESKDEDGKQAWECESGCGVLMYDAESGVGLFYEAPEEDSADEEEPGDDD